MSGIVAIADSRPALVWLRQLYGKALSSVAPDFILPRRHLEFPGSEPLESHPPAPKTRRFPAAAELLSFRQDSANYSMPIAAGLVWRFSPIHF
jgi:hypothetical protein